MSLHTPIDYPFERTRLADFIRRHGYASLEHLQQQSVANPGRFWDEVVRALGLSWTVPYRTTLDLADGIMWPHWFVGGELDLVDNLVGKHARDRPDAIALRWEGDGGETRTLTWRALAEEVARVAGGLAALGLGEGERIALYLPMLPEAVVLMLAAARLGAISVPLFSAYGAESVAQRLRDCEASLLVCADGYFRRGREVAMLAEARRAARECPSLRHLVVVERLGARRAGSDAGLPEMGYRALRAAEWPGGGARAFPAGHPLMLIYTSGTTGKPKAVVHTHSGFPVKAGVDLMMAFDLHAGDTLMWVTDMGWLMGPWMVFGGLLLGATLMLYEGTPDYPDARRLWQVVARHGVTHLGLSPSLVRLLMSAPDAVPDAEPIARLRVFGSTGEAWNETPWRWLFETVGRGRRPIVNYTGGTEIGGGILASFAGLPQKPCGFSGPIPGMAADVLDPEGRPMRGAVGELILRAPWPGMTDGLWRDPARYRDTYWSRWPELWVHGDWARVDEDGHWFVHGRSDDTIKVAGKRVGPADFESALVAHPLVAEAVAVGVPDPLKGECAVCFVTLRDPARAHDWPACERELVEHVGAALGKPLRPAHIHRVPQVAKTKNGKILRRVMRAAYLGADPGDLTALENPAAVEAVRALRNTAEA